MDGEVGNGEGGFLVDDGLGGGFVADDEDDGGDFIPTGHDDMDEDGAGLAMNEEVPGSTLQDLDRNDEQIALVQDIGESRDEPQQDVNMRDHAGIPAARSPIPICDTDNHLEAGEVPVSERIDYRSTFDATPPQLASYEETTNEHQQTEWQVHGVAEAEQHTWPADADDESDQGSMLSHDPEDEDAEPDWLESD